MGSVRTGVDSLLKAAAAGLLVAVAVAALWRFFPQWQFYLSLALGFGVVEAVAYFTNNKRGRDLQILSMALVTIGFVLSRWFLADRFGISLGDLNNLTQRGTAALQLRAVPDLLFVALAYIIAWVRFR